MPETFIKPSDEIVQSVLKVMKNDFDRRNTTAEYIPGLIRAAVFPNNDATAAWSGDIFDQVAAWNVRHGDPGKAHDYYQASLERYHPAEALGPARSCRGFARLHVERGRLSDAFDMFKAAEAFHARDRHNDKGLRQQRITSISLLEARVVADDDRTSAVDELTDIALFDIGDLCLRDQHDRVQFVLPYSSGAALRALRVRQLEINAARRRPIGTATSIARVVIDKELHITSRIAGAILTKGVARLPRP